MFGRWNEQYRYSEYSVRQSVHGEKALNDHLSETWHRGETSAVPEYTLGHLHINCIEIECTLLGQKGAFFFCSPIIGREKYTTVPFFYDITGHN